MFKPSTIFTGESGDEHMNTAERVRKIIVEHLHVEAEKATDGASFKELGADSLDGVEIVMALEEEFKVWIPDAEAERITTVGEMIKTLEQAVGAQQ